MEDFNLDDLETIEADDLFDPSSNGFARLPVDPDPIFLPAETLTRQDEHSPIGLATRYFNKYHKLTRYVKEQKSFYSYKNGVWTTYGEPERVKAQQIIEDVFEEMMLAKSHTEDLKRVKEKRKLTPEQVEDYGKWGEKAELLTKFYTATAKNAPSAIHGMLDLVRSHIIIDPNAFDPDPSLFNLANGSYELDAQRFREHRASDLCSMQSPVRYDAAAQCPYTLARFNEIFLGDGEIILFIQRLLGYSLSGHTSEQKFPILYGTGANGKGALFRLMELMFGDYAAPLEIDALSDDKQIGGHNESIANTRGKRVILISETEKRRKLATALVKKLSGEDTLRVSRKHEHEICFRPKFKSWFAANDKPEIHDTSEGMWRRPLLIELGAKFIAPSLPLGKNQFHIDPEAEKKMAAELPGFFNWVAEGYKFWRQHGLNPPQIVCASSAEYRKESDRLGQYIEERLMSVEQLQEAEKKEAERQEREERQLNPADYRVKVSVLYKDYQEWCEENGIRAMSKIALGKEFNARWGKSVTPGGSAWREGWVLKAKE